MGGLKLGKEAQAKFDEAKEKPDNSGYLEKKGAKRKNWNNRWFVLKDNYLFYCKNQKSNPQGIINLHACTVSRIEGPTARPNSFSVLAPKSVSIDAKWTNRTYFFSAKDEKEMDHWMKVLEESGKKAAQKTQKTGSTEMAAATTEKKGDNKNESGSEGEGEKKKPSSDSEDSDEKEDKRKSDSEEEKKEKKSDEESEEEEEEKKTDKKEKKEKKKKSKEDD